MSIERCEDGLDGMDRRLLDVIQKGVELVDRPWEAAGREAGIGEAECMVRLRRMKGDGGVIRQISGIFDTAAMGYASALVAGRYDAGKLQGAAEVVGGHPGVSHNYERSGAFNLWYTVAVSGESRLGLEGTIERLGKISGAEETVMLPVLRRYKIGVRFEMGGSSDASVTGDMNAMTGREEPVRRELIEKERRMVRLLQGDLEMVEEPFERWAAEAGCGVRELLDAGRRFLETGQMRRFAAVLHHRRAGVMGNAMVVWRVTAEEADQMGERLAEFREVSHCYLRPGLDGWPVCVYTMVHGQTREAVEETVARMREATGIGEAKVMWSLREFKKERVRYFTGEEAEWEAAQGTGGPMCGGNQVG